MIMMMFLLLFIILSLLSLSLSLKSTSSSSLTTTSSSRLSYKKDSNGVNGVNKDIDVISKDNNDNKGGVNTIAALLSATSLIAGTTVGAGILALPAVAIKPGFIYSSIGLIGAWMYMVSTGLLIAEVSCNSVAKDPINKDSGILALTRNIIGSKEATISGLVYIFIHYALLIAYIAEAGDIINQTFNIQSLYIGPILFTSIIGSIVAFGSSSLIELTNNIFVIIVFISFISLVLIGLPLVNISNLLTGDIHSLGSTIPVMLVALVYHNIVPSICSLLKYDKNSIQKVIVTGSFIPLLMFLIWNFVILGIGNNDVGVGVGVEGFDPVNTLRQGSGNQLVSSFISIFSESAIITSFLGFVIGLMSFYTDVFPNKSNRDLGLYSLVLLPPLIVALYNRNIFLNALDYAGSYGISLLFGAIPCLLSWKLRDKYKDDIKFKYENFIPFGSTSLIVILILTGYVVVQKLI